MAWLRRLINVFRTDRLARDAERELAFHLEERVDELVASGWTETAARREARRRFGRHDEIRERVHRVEALAWLESLLADLRYAIRGLRSNPVFTGVAVASLALGIGANTAIFSLINAVMLRSLPVSRPEQIVQVVVEANDGGSAAQLTNPMWEAIRDRQTALARTFAFADRTFDLGDGGLVRPEAGALVSGDYFDALGVRPSEGRLFSTPDDVRGCPSVAVLGHGFWQREYGGAVDAIGRTLTLNGHPFEIIGVAGEGFGGIHVGRSAGIFAPFCTLETLRPDRDILDSRGTWFVNVFGRTRPGETAGEAQAALAGAAREVFDSTVPTHWTREEQQMFRDQRLAVLSAPTGRSIVRGQYRTSLYTLLVVVGVVLLIACANVAQLLLARATARQHEVAVRLAIGSGRGRLIRQLLTESILLALLGAGVGVLFARWSSGVVVGFISDIGRAVSLDLSLDLRVLFFTIGVAVLTGVLFGLAPAWRSSRVSPQTAMHGSGRAVVGASSHRFARGIVTGQLALSFVLVVSAGLLVGSFQRLTRIDPGFRPSGVGIVEAGWDDLGLSEERHLGFPRELIDRIRQIPGVRSASASLLTPISGTSWSEDVLIDRVDGAAEQASIWFNGVTDGYFETLDTRLLAGRDFSAGDDARSARVVIVNETLAERYYGDASPIGGRVRIDSHSELGDPMEIIGVVADAKYRRVDEETLATAFVPLEQTSLWSPSIRIVVRGEAGPAALLPAVTEAMREIHPAITLDFDALTEQIAASLARPRLLATLSGFFGALALLLAVVGLYGTMAYSVTQRRNEMGVRIALGARGGRILALVAADAGRLIFAGLAIGALLAFAGTRLIAALLYGVTATDGITLAISAALLGSAAMAAALIPAWRAAGVDPAVTLRAE
ncbi:MAG: ABC transporter permease [Gemmatimonadetes bacterium]|nr:ABC transporter permease [Gemmatimonadota bacterium]